MPTNILTHEDEGINDVLTLHNKVAVHEAGTLWRSGRLVDNEGEYIVDSNGNRIYTAGTAEA